MEVNFLLILILAIYSSQSILFNPPNPKCGRDPYAFIRSALVRRTKKPLGPRFRIVPQIAVPRTQNANYYLGTNWLDLWIEISLAVMQQLEDQMTRRNCLNLFIHHSGGNGGYPFGTHLVWYFLREFLYACLANSLGAIFPLTISSYTPFNPL